MICTFGPHNINAEVKSVEFHRDYVAEGFAGDMIGFQCTNIGRNDIKRGHVASNNLKNPCQDTAMFMAQIVILNYPNRITTGYTPVIDVHTAHVPCRIGKILARIDKRTGVAQEQNPPFIKQGDGALVEFIPERPLVVEKFSEFPALGRFTIRDMKKVVGVGIIREVERVPHTGRLLYTPKKEPVFWSPTPKVKQQPVESEPVSKQESKQESNQESKIVDS